MDIKDKVGERLRQVREKKNLSQGQLSEIAGVDRTFISHIENGKRNLSLETLEKLLVGLKISFKEFFKTFKD